MFRGRRIWYKLISRDWRGRTYNDGKTIDDKET